MHVCLHPIHCMRHYYLYQERVASLWPFLKGYSRLTLLWTNGSELRMFVVKQEHIKQGKKVSESV